MTETIVVYLIQGGGLAKIGVSRNIDQRLKTLQASSPEKLAVLGSRVYDRSREAYSTERELHARFEDKRGHGEWFDLTDEDINTIVIEYNFTQIET